MVLHRDLLALLLVWEIGKPWRLAVADVDRCLDGVRWYVDEIERQLAMGTDAERRPCLAQYRTDCELELPDERAGARRAGSGAGRQCRGGKDAEPGRLPLPDARPRLHGPRRSSGHTLSGIGGKLGDVLISNPRIGALAFVGGRSNGRAARHLLADHRRRHFLEQEGLNGWGIWDFTEWELLAQHLRKGSQTPSSGCTAYPRYVVQRRLLPAFLDTYLPVVEGLRFGHPLAVERPDDPLPELDFGPVIGARKAAELGEQFEEADAGPGLPLYRGSVGSGRFLDGQDTSAYVAPACVLRALAHWSLHHAEPFGPLDSVVCVDTEAELLAAMNASNGCLVAQPGDRRHGLRVARRRAVAGLQGRHQSTAQPGRPGGVFGGMGESWKAPSSAETCSCRRTARTARTSLALFGNFPDYSRSPAGDPRRSPSGPSPFPGSH